MNEREIRGQELRDISLVLATDFGRRVMRRVLDACRTYASVTEPVIRPNGVALEEEHGVWWRIGRQDLGHFLINDLATADPVNYKLMNDEAWVAKLAAQKKENPDVQA